MQSEKSIIRKAIKLFEWQGNGIDDKANVFYKCRLCSDSKAPLNGKSKTNLLKHIQKQHTEYYDDKIAMLNPKNYHFERLKMLLQFVEVVTINGRPFLSLLDSGWKGIYADKLAEMKAAGYCLNIKGNDFEVIKEKIYEIASRIQEMIATEIKDKCISFMSDIGTKNEESFLGIDIQYNVDGFLTCRSIGMIHLEESHTAEYLLNVLDKCTKEYGIKLHQFVSMTTDNGANIKKTRKDINNLPPNHELVTSISHSRPLCTSETDERIQNLVQQKSDDDVISELLARDDYSRLMSEFVNKYYAKAEDDWFLYVSGINCCVHTVQLIMDDAFKRLAPADVNVIQLCLKAAKFLRLPSTRNELKAVGIEIKKVRLYVKTRWCSKLNMVI